MPLLSFSSGSSSRRVCHLYNRSKILALAVLICLPLGLLSLPQGITEEISKEPAQFIISSWSYPDEYGQGIEHITYDQNSTGAWLPFAQFGSPDAFVNTTPNLATDGGGDPEETGDYTDTHQIASAMFTLDASSPYEAQLMLVFADIPTLTESNFVSVSINLYAQTFSTDGSVTTKDFLVYSRDGPALVKNGEIYDCGFGEDYGWTNVTLTDPNYFNFLTQGVTFYAQCADDSLITVSFKYAEVTFAYQLLEGEERGRYYYDSSDVTFDLEYVGSAIRLTVYSWLNSAITGATDTNDGKNYQQHNVVVTASNGTILFSQQNFTYVTAYDIEPMYYYQYEVILNFLPQAGDIYIVAVTYEFWW